jgi:thiol-disulfide isomerase/thioredoxin
LPITPDNDDSSAPTTSVFLTKSNYDSLTSNKTVFVKWAAPWCGHSQELAPAWDRLVAATFDAGTRASGDDSDSFLIAEVDCSREQEWCVEMGYTAYPTLTFGDGSMGGMFLQTYTSVKKDYDDLLKLYKNELLHESFCTPGNLAACDDAEEQDRIRHYSELPIEELERLVAKEEARISEAEKEFERRNQELQVEYDKILKDHESNTATVKRQLKLFKKSLREQSP